MTDGGTEAPLPQAPQLVELAFEPKPLPGPKAMGFSLHCGPPLPPEQTAESATGHRSWPHRRPVPKGSKPFVFSGAWRNML